MVTTSQNAHETNDFNRSAPVTLHESMENNVTTALKDDKAGNGGNNGHSNDDHGNNGHGHETKTVTIIVNSIPKVLPKGKYLVSDLKRLVGIPADYEMDQVKDGILTPLLDTDEIHIKDGDEFIGQVKTGGSS
jgi:hypothetical protein